jgi:hypothetical protein
LAERVEVEGRGRGAGWSPEGEDEVWGGEGFAGGRGEESGELGGVREINRKLGVILVPETTGFLL